MDLDFKTITKISRRIVFSFCLLLLPAMAVPPMGKFLHIFQFIWTVVTGCNILIFSNIIEHIVCVYKIKYPFVYTLGVCGTSFSMNGASVYICTCGVVEYCACRNVTAGLTCND